MRAGQDCAEIGVGRQHHAILGGGRRQHHLVTSTVQTEVGSVHCVVTKCAQPFGQSRREACTRVDARPACLMEVRSLPCTARTGRSDAVPVLAEYLTSEDEAFRSWVVHGLQRIDTSEARSLLWEARHRHS